MSTAQELNQLGNCVDNSICKPKYLEHIPFKDLERDKKYKVNRITVFRKGGKYTGQVCIRVAIANGYLILADSYKEIIAFIKSNVDQNDIYVTFTGYGKRNKAIVQFYEGEKPITLDSN